MASRYGTMCERKNDYDKASQQRLGRYGTGRPHQERLAMNTTQPEILSNDMN